MIFECSPEGELRILDPWGVLYRTARITLGVDGRLQVAIQHHLPVPEAYHSEFHDRVLRLVDQARVRYALYEGSGIVVQQEYLTSELPEVLHVPDATPSA